MKGRKLKVHINMDNDWMCCVRQNRGRETIILELCHVVDFQKIKMHFARLLLCLWSYFDETYTTLGC